jgi:hypothetical protein
MARNENPPFPRGGTFWGGTVPTASADYAGKTDLEGKTWLFEDLDYSVSAGVKPYRTGKYVKCMCVRNVSAAAMLPKQVVHMKTSGSGKEFAGQVDTIGATVGQRAYPVDEFLPAAGVAVNDLFWVVVEGPATVTSDTAGTTTITVGLYVIPGSGTAGRVVAQDMTVAAGTATFAQINGAIGVAITATSGNSQDLLIDVIPRTI